MKYKYIVASALSLAVVGASIVSPFTYSVDNPVVDNPVYEGIEQILDLYRTINNYIDSANIDKYMTSGAIRLEQFGSLSDSVPSFTYDIVLINPQTYEASGGGYGVYYNSLSYYFTNNNYTRKTAFSGGLVVYDDGVTWYNNKFKFDGSGLYRCVYCDLPSGYYSNVNNSSTYMQQPILNLKRKFPNSLVHDSIKGSSLGGEVENIITQYTPPPTNPPNTTPAPGFPNLPDVWVNGDGNTYNIDLPDFDFNLELPEYTMPEAVSIPAEFVQKSSALYQVPLNIIDRFGLWWLVGLALICTVITLIINR